ncbi:hypothetical protein M409DRAFT_70494 [Zasmidium cellare ATCC 36951]|uniref:FAD/NAD(P)-binding domain-containing protein n=1 Tax=Zasmidium cellare ATCC 36951 TaxID=1080233 RepID=A0A6A6C1Z7_ZASCE|nr:uncharacterized protein M409DRAFT_70494 [Zasmidium cellare ATCC 36951]KAF2160318.1 hypothetical protein M409DRAFT_70494 [Zasmidium cellare ATCC 36951]
MAFDTLRLILLAIKFITPYALSALLDQLRIVIHKHTYNPVDSPKNIIVVGGSFAGIQVAQRLANSVPTGYRVVLIERNSHFNYTFNFPRYTVLQGHERLAFIPYDHIAKSLPVGSLGHVRGSVADVKSDVVLLQSGEQIPYDFLVMATGCSQSPPAKLSATDRGEACQELRAYQQAIEAAGRVAVVGGGAVGVELVADVKSYYPDKQVTLIHSRNQLLPRFGPRLHTHVLGSLEKLGVEVLLDERPEMRHGQTENGEKGSTSLTLRDGSVVDYDIVIPCTRQTPHSSILSTLTPDAICTSTSRILVHPTLQVSTKQKTATNIFALGDVAETGGPKMARAAFFQASVVQKNILSRIRGRKPSAVYKPQPTIEGSLKLTIGKTEVVTYCQPEKGAEILLTNNKGRDDLEVERAWRFYGADIRDVKSH